MPSLLAFALFGLGCLASFGCGANEASSEIGDADAPGSGAQGGSESDGGTAGHGGSESSSGGTGGSTTGSGGDGASGGSTGATGGSAGSANAPGVGGGAAGVDSGTAGEMVFQPGEGACIPPCELELGPSDNLPGESAVVLYDFDHGVALLTNDAAANAESEWVIGFNYETDPQKGYGAWSTGGWWFAFTEPLPYVEGTYSLQQYVEMTTQMVNPTTNQVLIVVYSFGEQTVSVHDVYVPDCSLAASGACASPSDCAAIDEGLLRPTTAACMEPCSGSSGECVPGCVSEAEDVSIGCSRCYAEFVGCVSANCSSVCPGKGGNVCMSCEAGASGCHLAFMACSGLDHMPRGTLTWPLGEMN